MFVRLEHHFTTPAAWMVDALTRLLPLTSLLFPHPLFLVPFLGGNARPWAYGTVA